MDNGWQRKCLWRFVISSLVGFICVPTLAHSLETYSFQEKNNATFHFNHELSNEFRQYNCEIFSLNSNHPFYVNGDVDQTSLRPEQRGRFLVRIAKARTNVTVSVYIREIVKTDAGVYIVTIRETIADKFKDSIYDAYIKVNPVPPKPDCEIYPSKYGNQSREMHCKTTVEGDINGKVICFQDSDEAVSLHHSNQSNELFSVFLVRIASPVNCCFLEDNVASDTNSCNHFVHGFYEEEIASASVTNGIQMKELLSGDPIVLNTSKTYSGQLEGMYS